MKSTSQTAFNRLLSELNRFLKPYRFRRAGQSFARETVDCWQVIGMQKSRFSDAGEVRFTVNFGVTSKVLMELRGQNPSKMPPDWSCPIRSRIGELLGLNDTWWGLRQEGDFRSALPEIMSAFSETAIPLFDKLNDNVGILRLYATGKVMGFEVDRDETRAVLFAHLGMRQEAADAITKYELRWNKSPAADRAQDFAIKYRIKFGF